MKKLFTLLLLTSLCAFSHAQLRLAILGGPHSSSVTEKNNLPGWDSLMKPNYKNRSGLNLGVMAEVPLGGNFYLHPGVFYMAKGNKYEKYYDTAATGGDTLSVVRSFSSNYIDIPINVTYKIPLGKKSNFLLSAGPYISFFYNGKTTVESRVSVGDTAAKYTNEQTPLETGSGQNKIKTVDFGVNARAGFELGSFLLTGFFSQGLTNFYNASYDGTFKHRVYGASIGFWLNGAPERKPKDKDKDGVPDKEDGCPLVAGPAATHGCPDKDGDGVADNVDKCPDVAGLPKYQGCPIPDTDGDGINDEIDQCPNKPGTAKYKGCPIPDTDGDGINDEEDQCPDKPGTAKYKGCPIPDTDGDGVNDEEDKCPNEAGPRENNGCPVIKQEIIEKVNYAAKNIFFATGSDKITPSSFTSLDDVATILRDNPLVHLSIEGHSDNVGNADKNLALSQKRANAVQKYLVQKGIAAERVKATGYGQQKPIADNNTAEGRAQNRRVELKLSQE
ncbi:MAG: OmpA family protein [Chitinophagaceae bacterium]